MNATITAVRQQRKAAVEIGTLFAKSRPGAFVGRKASNIIDRYCKGASVEQVEVILTVAEGVSEVLQNGGMPTHVRDAAIEALCAQLTLEEQLLSAPTLSNHQAAVNYLVELSMSTPDFCASFPGTRPVLPFDQVPALFRVAIQEAKAAGSRNPYPGETDLVEHALMLIERNGGDANIRTPELDEFLSSLLISPVDGHFRVTYSPSDVTVH